MYMRSIVFFNRLVPCPLVQTNKCGGIIMSFSQRSHPTLNIGHLHEPVAKRLSITRYTHPHGAVTWHA